MNKELKPIALTVVITAIIMAGLIAGQIVELSAGKGVPGNELIQLFILSFFSPLQGASLRLLSARP